MQSGCMTVENMEQTMIFIHLDVGKSNK
jgi:hypothetical protein